MNPLTWVALAVLAGALAYSALRHALLSLTLALAIVVLFFLNLVGEWMYPLENPVSFDLSWVSVPGLYQSPPWTFATTIFVHAGAFHLMFNLLGFLLITPVLEERIGSLRWALIFFGGAALGQVLFILARHGQSYALVGASGGLLAVLGAFARLYPRERMTLFLPIPGSPAVPVIWIAIGYLVLSFALVTTSFASVAYEAHIGGIVFGFAAAPLIMRVPVRQRTAKLAAFDAKGLEPLATTRELRQILDELKVADVPEVQRAWIEKFTAKAVCPRCGSPLRYRRGALSSPCGWRLPPK